MTSTPEPLDLVQSIESRFRDQLDLDNDPHPLEPRLPPEIEYEIFVLTFKSYSKDSERINLLCVAKRIEDWLVPFIYDVIVYDTSENNRPSLSAIKRYGKHVRQVLTVVSYVSGTDDHCSPLDLLKYCPNIWNLGFWLGPPLNEDVFTLKCVKRVVLNDLDFFHGLGKGQESDEGNEAVVDPLSKSTVPLDPRESLPPPIPVQRQEWFANTTHIFVSKVTIETSAALLLFPKLTHLMLLSSNTNDVLQHVLRSLPRLKLFVWLLVSVLYVDKITLLNDDPSWAARTEDERVVTIDCIFADDWMRMARGEQKEDIWDVAERAIRERKKGSRTSSSNIVT